MPAIQLARLKIQTTKLLVHFDDPKSFETEFHALLNFYADRTRRPGRSGQPKPLIQAYNVPRQILRRIENDLAPLIQADPEHAILMADRLWADPWYESRQLAISILGMLGAEQQETIVDRLQAWSKTCREDALLDALLDTGAAGLRAADPEGMLRLIEVWLGSGDKNSRKIGLRALPALILLSVFENLPVVYRLLAPFLREAASSLEVDLTRAVRALGERSPEETAFYLNQNLSASHKAGLTTIVRNSLDVLPPDLAEMLRARLREQMRMGRD